MAKIATTAITDKTINPIAIKAQSIAFDSLVSAFDSIEFVSVVEFDSDFKSVIDCSELDSIPKLEFPKQLNISFAVDLKNVK
jgi:hypothetical protein